MSVKGVTVKADDTVDPAENFSVLRRMALNLLKSDKTTKRSLAGKRKDAAWDNDYLLKVLAQ